VFLIAPLLRLNHVIKTLALLFPKLFEPTLRISHLTTTLTPHNGCSTLPHNSAPNCADDTFQDVEEDYRLKERPETTFRGCRVYQRYEKD